MDKKRVQVLAEKAGFSWLNTKEYSDEFHEFDNKRS